MEADCTAMYTPRGYALIELEPANEALEVGSLSDPRLVHVFLAPDGVRIANPSGEPAAYESFAAVLMALDIDVQRRFPGGYIRELEYLVYVDEQVKVGDVGLALAMVQIYADPKAIVMVGRRNEPVDLTFPSPKLAAELYRGSYDESFERAAEKLKTEGSACPLIADTLRAIATVDPPLRCETSVAGFRKAAADCRRGVDWDAVMTMMLYFGRTSEAGHLAVPRPVTIDWLVSADIEADLTWASAGAKWLAPASTSKLGRLPITSELRDQETTAKGLIEAARSSKEQEQRAHAVACAVGLSASCAERDLASGD